MQQYGFNRLIVLALLILIVGIVMQRLAFAVPACPEAITVKQPGGRALRVFLRGDEYLHWHEDESGYTILKAEPEGPWVYAVRDDTGRLVGSPLIAGEADPVQLGVPKRLLPPDAAARASSAAAARVQQAVQEEEPPRKAPRTGTMRNLVLLVSFSDKGFSNTRAEYEALFNTIGYTADGAQGSVKDFYNEVSYGQLSVDSVVVEPVTLNHGYAYYGANDVYGNDVRPREMVQQALAALEARGFDFSALDGDNDGWVDGLTVIHAGGGEEYNGNDSDYIWSHKWQMTSTVTYDGKSMFTYHTEPGRRGWDSSSGTWGITRIGVICHENGHFLGLPDLYDYGYDSKGVGDFCLMAGGSWNGNYGAQPAQMSAWCKKYLAWLTPVVVTGGGTYSVPRVEDHQAVYQLKGAFPATQYFLIENRQGFGFDASLPGSSRGLLVWHVDETQANNNDQTHYKVDLEEASGTQHLELDSNEGDDADYFRNGTMTMFTAGTTPNNLGYSGAALGLDVAAVSASGATMTFTIGAPPLARFEWDPIASPQTAGNPIPVRITAKDGLGGTVSAFTGMVNLSGHIDHLCSIGSGSSAWNYPLSTYYHDARTQVIYLAGELGGPGTFTGLALDIATLPGQLMNNWTIRMKHTALSGYPPAASWESSGWTVAYQANQTIGSTGWVPFTFSAPFVYNGTDNLMIDFSFNNSSWTTDGTCRYTPGAANRSIYFRTDSGFGDPLAWSGTGSPSPERSLNVPNIRLLLPETSVPITPPVSAGFSAGVWTGTVAVPTVVTGVQFRADDGAGHAGESAPFTTVPSVLDSDGDGVPDWWTSLYFGHPTGQSNDLSRAGDDASGTGQDNLFKYVAGLNPTNPASLFRLRIEPAQPGRMRLVFSPRWEDRYYALLFRTNLAAGAAWTNVTGAATTDNGTERSVTDLNASGNSKFYRVRITLP